MLKKIVLSLLLSCIIVSPLFAKTKSKNIYEKLTIATEATYPPFVYFNSSGDIQGFDADIINALCDQIHAKCELQNTSFDSLIPSLQIGRFDAVFGGMGITPAREKVVDFTKPYYKNSVTFVVKKDSKFLLNNIKGKTVGVQIGTTFAKFLHEKYKNLITIKTYASNMEALMDLKLGRINAVFLDKPVAVEWLKNKHNQEYTTVYNIYNDKYFGIGNGIAIKKNNQKLIKVLNHALVDIKANGKYQKIVDKWFKK